MEAFTAKNYTLDRAPKKIALLGDKSKKIESSQHIIEFPGGAIEVSRTTDGKYWAHIIVNRGFSEGDGNGMCSAAGEIVEGRIASDSGVHSIPAMDNITQIALLIEPIKA